MPDDLKWEIREYTQGKVPLILEDVPRNNRKRDTTNGKPKDEKNAEKMETEEVKEEEEEVKKEEEKRKYLTI